MRVAYARISSVGQNLEGQIDALKKEGYDKLITDMITGTKKSRIGLDAVFERLMSGDTLIVYRLDRLGRSMAHLIEIINDLAKKEIHFISLSEKIDTSTASGMFMFNIFAAIADFERNLIVERTMVGLEAARARGRKGGRPKGMSKEAEAKAKACYSLYKSKRPISEIMTTLSIGSKATIYKYVREMESRPEFQENLKPA
jgi:DNA invertase Pin-like site-specific DNA recombinase